MITIKTLEEINVMELGGKRLSKILDTLGELIAPGVRGDDIEKMAEKLIRESGGTCNFKEQGGFPSCLCFSVNNEIVHGLPRGKVLKQGDIMSLDLGIFFRLEVFLKNKIDYKKYPNLRNGFHTDMAKTYLVGDVDPELQRLVRVTKKALKRGLKKVKPGVTFGDIGETIERYVDSQGFGIVRDLCGHGIGKNLHEDPEVLNYGKRHSGPTLKEGMVFCIEPMLVNGGIKIKKGKDGFSYVTEDGSAAAHFEHMVAVVRGGAITLTD
jgi:methionyl aminopeptidase